MRRQDPGVDQTPRSAGATLIAEYLQRLQTAAADLPQDRRAELLQDIHAHIDEAIADAGTDDEVAVRHVLERLGSPEQIAVEAGVPDASPSRPATPRSWAALALVVLGIGSVVLPIVGWMAGAVLVVASDAWPPRDKWIGLGGPFVLMALVLAIGAFAAATGGVGAIEALVLLGVGGGGVGGLLGAAYLALRLRARRS